MQDECALSLSTESLANPPSDDGYRDLAAKIALAFTPPAHEQESGFFFRRRLEGMTLPLLSLENIRLNRQLRSIWKKLFLDGVLFADEFRVK
jgi:hypothetical protein